MPLAINQTINDEIVPKECQRINNSHRCSLKTTRPTLQILWEDNQLGGGAEDVDGADVGADPTILAAGTMRILNLLINLRRMLAINVREWVEVAEEAEVAVPRVLSNSSSR
jgi:hypothetical protein